MNASLLLPRFACGLGLGLIVSGPARATIDWDGNGGTGGDWHQSQNWTSTDGDPDNTVPTTANAVRILNASSVASPVTIFADNAAAASLIVGPRIGAVNYTGYLSIATNLTMAGAFTLHQKGKGYVTHSAGTMTCGTFTLAASSSVEGTGYYDLIDHGKIWVTGDLTTGGGTDSILTQDGADTDVQIDGGITSGDYSPAVPWRYTLETGKMTVNGTVSRKYGAWRFDQRGGTAVIGGALNLGTGYRSAGTHGEPYEWIIGGDSSLSVGGSVLMGCTDGNRTTTSWGRMTLNGTKAGGGDVLIGGNWRQTGTNTPTVVGTKGVLKAVIDAAAIATPSAMRKVVVSTGTVTFDSGSMVQPVFDPLTTPTDGTWTVMTWGAGKATNNGLVLEAGVDPSVWSFAVTSTGLTVTYKSPLPPPTLIMLK